MKNNAIKIFISHSSKDKELVDNFVDKILVCGMGFNNHEDIFCTSIEGLGIKSGNAWRDEIKQHLCNAGIVILFITPNYKESEMCLNEMGAAWALDAKVIPIIVPPIDFDNIGVLYEIKQAIKLTESSDLDELKDELEDFTNTEIKTARWNAKKLETIAAIEKYLEKNPFKVPITREAFNKMQKELLEIKAAFNEVIEEKEKYFNLCTELEKLKNKEDVQKIKQDFGLLNDYNIFIEKAEEIGKLINKQSCIIRTLLFYNLTDRDMSLSSDVIRANESELKKAYSADIINEEEKLNFQHPIIYEIDNLWNDLEHSYNNLSEPAWNYINDNYKDFIFDIKNLGFWENIMGVQHISF